MSIRRPAVYNLPVDLPRLLRDIERYYYAEALARHPGSAAAAARELGVNEHTARHAMARLGVRPRQRRPWNARFHDRKRRQDATP